MTEDLIYEVQRKVYECRMKGIEPELVTMHPDTLREIVNFNKLHIQNFGIPTGEYRLFGVKVARSLDVKPGEMFVA